MTPGRIRISAHAKVNLFLRILAREADGFHGLETLFCLLDLADDLTAARRDEPGVALHSSAADLGPVEENLAVRAARLVLEATGGHFGVELTLEKRIPVRAGLGGGSSDAAAALLAVNRLAGDAVPHHELLQFAARLGSDVAFFLATTPLALGWSRGERLLRLPALPAAPALLLLPPVSISTPEAYRWVDQARLAEGNRGALALALDDLASWGSIGRMAGNTFESAVFGRHPQLRQAYEVLAATRPLVCRLSGSGSALFAIYRSEGDREDARMTLGRKHGTVLGVGTMASPPPGPEER